MNTLTERTNRRLLEGTNGVVKTIGGKNYISFTSSDYLGLSSSPLVKEAFHKAAQDYGLGGSPALLTGHTLEHEYFEKEIAAFLGMEDAILFSSTYLANAAAVQGVMPAGSHILHDKLNHKSLIDASSQHMFKASYFPHLKMNSLELLYERLLLLMAMKITRDSHYW